MEEFFKWQKKQGRFVGPGGPGWDRLITLFRITVVWSIFLMQSMSSFWMTLVRPPQTADAGPSQLKS